MVLGYRIETIFVKQGDKYKKGVKDTIAHNGETSFSKLTKIIMFLYHLKLLGILQSPCLTC